MGVRRFDPLPDQPRDAARFEQLMLASLVVGAIIAVLMTRHVIRHVGLQTGAILMLILFGGAFALTLLASRRASRVARWLLVIGTVLALVPWLAHVPNMAARGYVLYLSLLQLVLQVGALVYLFTARSRAWFARRAYASDGQT
ncbi:MAG: hypothetical protein J0J01_00245 [Reyranella sp.]|uniref:hypothetical protein n=1 Tax=Reyranella sp. TaxID=1929291 RepID=UPI001AC57510|nr:hypothetical protein [Reyranella sp.]MBN9085307.1 hypothetical protein [Reyranella sp.]